MSSPREPCCPRDIGGRRLRRWLVPRRLNSQRIVMFYLIKLYYLLYYKKKGYGRLQNKQQVKITFVGLLSPGYRVLLLLPHNLHRPPPCSPRLQNAPYSLSPALLGNKYGGNTPASVGVSSHWRLVSENEQQAEKPPKECLPRSQQLISSFKKKKAIGCDTVALETSNQP